MKTSLLLLLLLFTGMAIQAQKKFIGTIEYEVKDFEEDEDEAFGPTKMVITRNPDKILLKMFFRQAEQESWLLMNTLNDSFYRISPEKKTYIKHSLNDENDPDMQLKRTDSLKDILGYKCRGYRVAGGEVKNHGYVWIAESLGGLNKEYPRSLNMNIFGGKYVMLSSDIYDDQQQIAAIRAVSIKKMDRIPDSLFDISGFKSIDAPPYDSPAMADSAVMYVDTLAVKPPVKKLPKKKAPVKKVRVKTKPGAIKPKH